MNNLPLVSILVPVYNVEKYIERCARSVFEQTYENLEFIFVDDCTPDNSIQILEQVLSEYPERINQVKIIHHDKNYGLATTRNTLVDNSKGEFILHVDSDDWIERNAVELLTKRQSETEADIVSGRFCRHTTNEKQDGIRISVEPLVEKDREDMLKTMLKYGSVVAIWNRLIRSSLYLDYGIRCVEGIDAGEDLMISPRLVYYSQKVASCNSITYHYDRSNAFSYVNTLPHSWDMQLQLIRACQLNVAFFCDKEESFSEAMHKQLAQRLKRGLELTFDNRNHDGYKLVLSMLDQSSQKYWSLIGWDRPQRRWLDHHYYVARVLFPFLALRGIVRQKISS